MEVVFITYESELDGDEIESLFRERSQKYREMDGLLQKLYLHDEESGRVGGICVFDSKESADTLFESDIHSSLRAAYKVRDIDIARYHVTFPLYERAEFPLQAS
jgi:heme-degrading monooxygenase HmoA